MLNNRNKSQKVKSIMIKPSYNKQILKKKTSLHNVEKKVSANKVSKSLQNN